jgi:hypothetical protein
MGTLFKVVTKTSSSSRKRIWDMDCKYIKADTVLPYSSALVPCIEAFDRLIFLKPNSFKNQNFYFASCTGVHCQTGPV